MNERLLDKNQRPSEEELIDYCGESKEYFTTFNHFLATKLSTSQEIRFPYGNNYGWAITHRIKKKLICDVFAENNSFSVMTRLTNLQIASVYTELSDYSKNIVDHYYPCGEGGWIHYRVTNPEQLTDITKLLNAKCGR